MSQQARAERIALNESRFREINDRVKQDIGRLSRVPELIEFVCECARLDCRAQIALSEAEYDKVRQDSRHFAIAPGHDFPEAEDVIEQGDRYAVVRKHPETWGIVQHTDPRSEGP